MIEIQTSTGDFSYDIQALIRSFFPKEKLVHQIGLPDKIQAEDGEKNLPQETSEKEQNAGWLLIQIMFLEEKITIEIERKCTIKGTPYKIRRESDFVALPEKSWHKDKDKSENPARSRYKNLLKRLIFLVLKDVLGREPQEVKEGIEMVLPPWGTLTGVRPVKVALAALEQTGDKREALRHMQEEYLISEKKADLSLTIAERERELLSSLNLEAGCSLYIGIPFCPTTCLYCSFTSYPLEGHKQYVEDYLTALKKEMHHTAKLLQGKGLTTVYFGGGTPTTLAAEQLDSLLGELYDCFDMKNLQEFTVEAGRPDSITAEKLTVLKQNGVSRISVNPQTMNEQTLRTIGRRHTAEDTKRAFYLAREAGFDNINMDVIIGLPGETAEDFYYTLQEIEKMNPDSITMHSLVVKRASRLRNEREEGIQYTGGDMQKMLIMGQQFATAGDYEPYYMYRQKNTAGHAGSSGQENIGFARRGKEGLYNILIMEEKQTIVAMGAGASTKLHGYKGKQVIRSENVKSIKDYIERIDEMLERKNILFAE